MVTYSTTTEAHVSFITKDETTTDWKHSRTNQSLPLSTAVSDLYNAIAKETGVLVSPTLRVVSLFCPSSVSTYDTRVWDIPCAALHMEIFHLFVFENMVRACLKGILLLIN